MKHILLKCTALFVCLCLLCGAVPVYAADALRFWVASDTHYYSESDLGEMSDRYAEHMLQPDLFGYVSTQGQMQYESRAIVQSFLDDFIRSDAQYLLMPGDLTGGGRQSHIEMARMLLDAEKRSGKTVFVINGNHDCEKASGERRISMEEFREIYRELGYDKALETHDASASYTAQLDARTRLLAIDSCVYGEDEGKINRQVFAFIREQVEKAKADGITLVAMMHHSILPHYALQPMMRNWRSIAAYLANSGVRLVLTGHIHANDVTARTFGGRALYDVQTGSLITAPNAYRVVCMRDEEIDITSGCVTKIDTSLLPDGFSAAQKARMQKDFPAYARDCLESGVCKFLNRNIGCAWRVGRLLKLKEGTAAYDAADKVMRKLGDAVGLDIYASDGKPSIESVLAPFGVAVPQSEYRKPYQPAAKIMYGFFHGDEETISSPEDVTLVRVCLEGAVLYATETALTHGEQDKLVAALCRTARNPRQSLLRDAAGRIADALLRTLANGFCDDYSAPADITLHIGADA